MRSKQPAVLCLASSYHINCLFHASIVIFLTSAVISASYSGNKTDYEALLKIKSMITSQDPYGPLTTWNSSFHFCEWSGVTCGKKHGRVTYVVLESLGLKGYLSPHVGNLSFLRGLDLKNNSFQGVIPHELGRLSKLSFLNLGRNEINGVIPSNLSSCFNLQELHLGFNNIVGSIPMEIGILSKLVRFSVHFNNLTGGIPPFLGNITSIIGVSLAGNPLGGNIPDTLGHLKNLQRFFSGGCNLYGTIPHALYNLSLLTNFSLPENQLTGSLPPFMGEMLPNLADLQLRTNQLTGLLPSSVSNCSRLKSFEIMENKFSGELTIDFAKLRDIVFVYLADNLFEGNDVMKFIDSLKNCSRLEVLSLYNCQFQGVLPKSIGNLSERLNFVDLSGNQLYGSLPLSIGNLVGLTILNLGDNKFTGNIPSTIGKLQILQEVYLYDNQLSGLIPNAVGNMSSLLNLVLSSNMLEGHIPQSLGNCYHLSKLFLSDNKLSGKIPKQLLQLPSLSVVLNLSQNNLSGSLPDEVGDLKTLTYLVLSDNNLSGNLPSSLGHCTSLSFLYINHNLFQGKIPPSLRFLRGLVNLDLSHNNFFGQIPQFLEGFSLEYLNLSYNNFEGEVPTLGVFANVSAFSVLGNNRLCGGIFELGLPKCKKIEKHKKRFPRFVVVILIVSTLITIICLVYVWCKKKPKSQESQSTMSERLLQVSYAQLLHATNGFSEANLIGNGGFSSVYRGILDVDDRVVAIKVLHLQNRGARRSFTRECEAWRSVRHRNLLKIITSCSSIDFQGNDFKALVYEFMPKGSLHDWLHSSSSTLRLNLLQRISILIDVASALDYIHNDCQPTLVHGDLKPSNILLNDEMVAHVGDFGLARFLGTTSYQNSSSEIRGTIGYAAPEYGLGNEMTSNGDVYSFGILLLEVMTGKKPTDSIFNEGLSLHKSVSMTLPDNVADIIDREVLSIYKEDEIFMRNAKTVVECLASTLKIGVSCSMDSPPQRMDIRIVLHELQHIRDTIQKI